jgi:putative aldouronate transport system permease protein
MMKTLARYKYVYLMAFPVVLYYLIFHYIPMGGIVIAFQEYRPGLGFFRSKWVGFKNILEFLTGPYAWRTIKNTFLISVYQIIFGFPCPIIFALLLSEIKDSFFKKAAQTVS